MGSTSDDSDSTTGGGVFQTVAAVIGSVVASGHQKLTSCSMFMPCGFTRPEAISASAAPFVAGGEKPVAGGVTWSVFAEPDMLANVAGSEAPVPVSVYTTSTQ